jgi:hypothetical protein
MVHGAIVEPFAKMGLNLEKPNNVIEKRASSIF